MILFFLPMFPTSVYFFCHLYFASFSEPHGYVSRDGGALFLAQTALGSDKSLLDNKEYKGCT